MRTHPTNGSNHQISVVVRDQTPMLHTMNPSNYKMLPNQGGQGSLLLESTLLSPYRLAPKLSWTPPASQNTGESSIKRLGGCPLKLERGIEPLKMMGKLAGLSYGPINDSDLRAFHRVLENMPKT